MQRTCRALVKGVFSAPKTKVLGMSDLNLLESVPTNAKQRFHSAYLTYKQQLIEDQNKICLEIQHSIIELLLKIKTVIQF